MTDVEREHLRFQTKLVGMVQSAYLQGWSDAAASIRDFAETADGLDQMPGGRELLLAAAGAIAGPIRPGSLN